MHKIKKFLYILFNFIKTLLASILGFFFNLFNSKSKNKENIKAPNFSNISKPKEKITTPDFSTYHNEEPITRKNAYNIFYPPETLKIYIKEIFLEELKLEEKDLTIKEEEYLEKLTIKITPLLNENPLNSISKLKEQLQILVKNELENQIKKEQNNIYEPKVITPLISPKRVKYSPNISYHEKTKIKENILPDNNNNLNNPDLNSKSQNISFISVETLKSNISPSPIITNHTQEFNTPSNNEYEISPEIPQEIKTPIEDITTPIKLENKPQIPINYDLKETLDPNPPPTKELSDKPQLENHPETFDTYNANILNTPLNNFINTYQEEIKKEEFEDKNYDLLEEQLNNLLKKISELKLLNLSPKQKEELTIKEQQIKDLKDNLEQHKEKDIASEIASLNENIAAEDLKTLELELKKLYLEDKLDLQENLLNNINELEKISSKKAKILEKKLLKQKLKRTINIINLSNIPFFRNKFFRYFAINLLANKELKSFHSILKRKELEFEMPELSEINKGHYALEDATLLSKENYEYLSFLELEAFKKHPELTLDNEYISYITVLKNKFLKNQERLQKKEKVLNKYRIKIEKRVRKLKKINQNNLSKQKADT